MRVKTKLDGGLRKILILFLFFFVYSKNLLGTQILDYETEYFLNEILEKIIDVNQIKKKIKLKIIKNNQINAFVDNQNVIYVNSGLIEYSQDYVALVSVLAHEVGHIDLNHISQRTEVVKKNNKYNNLALLSIIAGSSLSQNAEILQSGIVSSAAIANQYIEFTKEQEMEADLYSLKTLKKLNIYSNSIIKLLETIENQLLEKGFSKNKQRISTHPYFEDRVLLLKNYENNKNFNLDYEYDTRFNFIKAKFIGYSNNKDLLDNLNEPYKTYAESIKTAKKGNLKMSLKNLNSIINENKNSFLLETKADILFSYGFTKEAIKFYKKNLEEYPKNFYAQIRIFENTKIENLSNYEINLIFEDNKNLLFKYYNNENILLKYIELAKQLNKKEWVEFFNLYLNLNKINEKNLIDQLSSFRKNNDKDLTKLIDQIESKIL